MCGESGKVHTQVFGREYIRDYRQQLYMWWKLFVFVDLKRRAKARPTHAHNLRF